MYYQLKWRLLPNRSVILCLIILLAGALPTAAQGRGGCSTDETIVVRLADSPYDGPRVAR